MPIGLSYSPLGIIEARTSKISRKTLGEPIKMEIDIFPQLCSSPEGPETGVPINNWSGSHQLLCRVERPDG